MLKDLVTFSRSYRGFDESLKLSRETLLSFVDCARLAPSSINIQPLKYYLACEKEAVSKIQPLTGWARALPDLQLPHPGKYPTAFIVICQDLNISPSIPRFQKDVGIAAQTILLAAAEQGLGGCMIGNYSPGKVKAALDLPENLAPVLIIALGKPDEAVVLTEASEALGTNYYRDENDVHYVPKRTLDEIIIP